MFPFFIRINIERVFVVRIFPLFFLGLKYPNKK